MIISGNNIMYLIAGQLYSQAPNSQPRKADIILAKVKEYIDTNAIEMGDFRYFEVEALDKAMENKIIKDFFRGILMPIPEFQELNLSQNEFERGIKVDDESRPKFHFTSAYSTIEWQDDFIDLEAFIQNLAYYCEKIIENSDTPELVKPTETISCERSKEIMDDIYNMIEEFNKQGWSTKEISVLTGYPEEDINKFKEE